MTTVNVKVYLKDSNELIKEYASDTVGKDMFESQVLRFQIDPDSNEFKNLNWNGERIFNLVDVQRERREYSNDNIHYNYTWIVEEIFK